MPFNIDYIDPLQPIVISIEGFSSAGEFVEIMEQITNSQEYAPNVNSIYDLTRMSFENIFSDFLHKVKIRLRQYGDLRGEAKIAYVCPADLQYGMTRVWEVFCDDILTETMVTRSMEEALAWMMM